MTICQSCRLLSLSDTVFRNPSTVMKIVPVSVTSQIVKVLRNSVLTCELRPGDRLVESKLCERFEVSRPSLREALACLASEGLLIHRPNRGYQVAEITLEGFKNRCELRIIVEGASARLAAKRASPEQVKALNSAAAIEVAADDAVALIEQNRRFHLEIAKATGNPTVVEFTRKVLDTDNQPYFYGVDLHACTTAEAITAEHLNIVDAVSAGDGKLAEKRMIQHIREKEARIVAAWNHAL